MTYVNVAYGESQGRDYKIVAKLENGIFSDFEVYDILDDHLPPLGPFQSFKEALNAKRMTWYHISRLHGLDPKK